MTSVSDILCGPCEYTHQHRDAVKWCTHCQEGFCRDCEKFHLSTKITREHKLISIGDYRKIAGLSINHDCKNHGKRLELFCKSHDTTICLLCVPSHHSTCKDVLGLEEAAKNAKRSTSLINLEETIAKSLENIITDISEREFAGIDGIEKQENAIRNNIRETRQKINQHLDVLEQKLLFDLAKQSEKCKSQNRQNIQFLKKSKTHFHQLKEQMLQLKTFASDLQVFLGTRQITESLNKHMEKAKTEIRSARNYQIEVDINTEINTLLKKVERFGKVKVVDSDANLRFRDTHTGQAQIPIVKIQTVHDIKHRLKQRFKIINQEQGYILITGCIILSNGHMLIVNCSGKESLMEYNGKGEHIRNIPVSCEPYDLTIIDTDIIAVSYGDAAYYEIINIKNNIVKRKIEFLNWCWGISYQDGKLFTVVRDEGIVVTDLTGRTLKTIKCDVSYVEHLTTSKDRLYYTDYRKNTVNCCSLNGEEIWVFKNESIKRPFGISADHDQNVFVTGRESNNLTVIQHDGTLLKTLLTASGGLNRPRVVYYDKRKKVLIVSDESSGNAALYDIV